MGLAKTDVFVGQFQFLEDDANFLNDLLPILNQLVVDLIEFRVLNMVWQCFRCLGGV